jgi:Ni/Co efflux regulator RcnB
MNKLICSLIVAVGFGSLPAANAEEAAPASRRTAVTSAHSTAQRHLTRRHHHRRHHRHHHGHRHHHRR